MKYIKSGIVIMVWLLCMGFVGLSFAQTNTDCLAQKTTCENSCTNAWWWSQAVLNCRTNCWHEYNSCMNPWQQPEENCSPSDPSCWPSWTFDPKNDYHAKRADCMSKCQKNNNKEFCDCKCDWGIVLNTDFPFIGRCISKWGNTADGSSSISAIAQAFTNIFMTLIITWGFAMVIRWWVQIAMGQNKEGMKKIQNVVIAFAALGSLGIILRLINPNFFK